MDNLVNEVNQLKKESHFIKYYQSFFLIYQLILLSNILLKIYDFLNNRRSKSHCRFDQCN